jgi:hypothetical protein
LSAHELLERQYHEMRWRVLSLAADFDRIGRAPGGADVLADDPRLADLRACVAELLSDTPGRAERVQARLSDTSPVV